jgi:hypothetical protein
MRWMHGSIGRAPAGAVGSEEAVWRGRDAHPAVVADQERPVRGRREAVRATTDVGDHIDRAVGIAAHDASLSDVGEQDRAIGERDGTLDEPEPTRQLDDGIQHMTPL